MSTLEEDIEAFAASAFEEPTEGETVWAFQLLDVDRSLEPEEVLARLKKGRGVYVIELVWDEDLELVQRGEGAIVRNHQQLLALKKRFLAMQEPPLPKTTTVKTAPKDTKAKTSAPWHGASLAGKLPSKKSK